MGSRNEGGTPAHGGFGYRSEVDGLRALAVVPVVLAHAGFEWFSGGYVGVDVFFVISGYLITSIILAEHAAGSFSLIGFYERRARRILPSLFVMLAVCLPLAWLWLTPHHLKGFSQSMVAVSTFAANVYFFLKSGYFDVGAEETPLLHTWSLGVEEQYYIAFPLIVMLCWRWGAKALTWVVMVTALVSLGLSEWASRPHPVGNFYLIATRAWELALGSLLAISALERTGGTELARPTREVLAGLGLALIVVPIFLYDHSTRFPGLYALPPTVGAALIIGWARCDTWVGRLLSLRTVVGVGLISYSVYLWHQPLFAFARLRATARPDPWVFVVLSAAAFLLGYLAWRYVERPFRDKRRFSRQQIFLGAATGSAVFIGLGLIGHFNEGFPSRFTAEQQAIMAHGDDPNTRKLGFPGERCFLSPDHDSSRFADCVESPAGQAESVVLWGDSHAAHLYPGLRKKLGPDRRFTTLTTSACPPIIDGPFRASCQDINRHVLDRIRQEKPARVVLAAVWGNYDWQQVQRTVAALQAAGISQIDLVGPVPRWNPSLPVVLTRLGDTFSKLPQRTEIGLDPGVRRIDAAMRDLAARNGARYVSPYTILCNAQGCLTRIDDRIESMVQWDVSHLTRLGSEFVVDRFW